MVGGSLWFWSTGNVSAGDIAAAGAISLRLSQMIGWVSYVLMTIYSNFGEIEDGVRTLTKPYNLEDTTDATNLNITQGQINFITVSFAYDRDIGGVNNISLKIRPGEKVGLVGLLVW